MRSFLTMTLILIGFLTNAQTPGWTPLEVSQGQPNLEFNPLKGIAANFGETNGFPYSIAGKVFTIGEVLNDDGSVNFTPIDNLLETQASMGNYSIIQINVDDGNYINSLDMTPSELEAGESYVGERHDLPNFLNSVDRLYYLGAGNNDFLTANDLVNRIFKLAPGDTEGNASMVVNYNDPLLVSTLTNLIQQLGNRYNNDKRLFAVHWGIYGIFGELQLGSGKFWIDQIPNPSGGNYQISDWEMTEANQQAISQAYVNAFPDKNLVARDGTIPNAEFFGFSDGLYFGASVSNTNTDFFLPGLQRNNVDKNWRNKIIGGEMDPFVQPNVWGNIPVSATDARPFANSSIIGDPDLTSQEPQNIQDVIEKTHMTFVFQNYMFQTGEVGMRGGNHRAENSTDKLGKAKFANTNNTVFWDNAIIATKRMGYTFHVNEFHLSSQGGQLAIEVNIKNTGVAPMYEDWDVEFVYLDATNQIHSLGTSSTWNLSKILPGQNDNKRKFIADISNTNLALDGTSKILMRVINPLNTDLTFFEDDGNGTTTTTTKNYNSGQPIRFDNATQDVDSVGWLTIGTDSNLGTFPTEVTTFVGDTYESTMAVGAKQRLSVTINPAEAEFKWVSNLEQIASVDQNGEVVTHQTGDVIIKAITLDGGQEVAFPITVNNYTKIPNRIEAEDFSDFFDDLTLTGFELRTYSVEDNLNSTEPFAVVVEGLTDGDWFTYNVAVAEETEFVIDFRASSRGALFDGGRIEVLTVENGVDNLMETITLDLGQSQPDPTNPVDYIYDLYTSTPFTLVSGNYTFKLRAAAGGSLFNLNWIEFRRPTDLSEYIEIPRPNDEIVDAGRFSGIFGVDVLNDATGNGKNLSNFFEQDDYIDYSVTAKETANFQIELNGSSTLQGGEFQILIDGVDIKQKIVFSNSGQNETFVSNPIAIEFGDHVLRLVGSGADGSAYVSSLDDLRFIKLPPTPEEPQLITDGFYLIKSQTNAYLTAPSSNGLVASQLTEPADDDNTAKWKFTHLGDNVYTINTQNTPSNLLGTPDGGGCAANQVSLSEDANATQDRFRWKATVVNGDTMFSIVNCPEFSLDVSSATPAVVNVSSTDASQGDQLFSLIPTNLAFDAIIPNRIEAETFSSVSSDLFTAQVNTEAFPVGVEEGPSGSFVGGLDFSEKLNYIVEALEDGQFFLDFRVAAPNGGVFNIYVDGVKVVDNFTLADSDGPNSVDFNLYDTQSTEAIPISQGSHTVQFEILQGSFNINWINFRDYSFIPSQVEAEDLSSFFNDAGNAQINIDPFPVGVEEGPSGSFVGGLDFSERLNYRVEALEGGQFELDFRVAAPNGGVFNIYVDGVKVVDQFTITDTDGPNSVDFNLYDTQSTEAILISQGIHTVQLEILQGGFNINWINFRDVSFQVIPSQVEAEDLSSFFNDAGNAQINIDPFPVGVEEGPSGSFVGGLDFSERLNYKVEALEDGQFILDFRVAAPNGGVFNIYVDGVKVVDQFTLTDTDGPNSVDFSLYDTQSTEAIEILQGKHAVQFEILQGGFNLNWINFRGQTDTQEPIITLIGDEIIDLFVGDVYQEQGATATDDVDGDITSLIVIGGDIVDPNVIDTYVVTYNVNDAFGNAANEVIRTINVIEQPDTEAPIALCNNLTISLEPGEVVTITAGQLDGGSTDNDGIASISIDQNTFDINDLGANNVTLTVVDNSGNVSTCTATVTIEETVLSVTRFFLVDADSNLDIQEIVEGDVIDLANVPSVNFNIRAATTNDVESVYLDLNGPVSNTRTENFAPYAVFGDSNGDYNGETYETGIYNISADPYSDNGLQGNLGTSLSVNFEITGLPSMLTVTKFFLVDADSDLDIQEIVEGDVIDLTSLPSNNLNIRAETTNDIESVRLELNGPVSNTRTENFAPYALFGDSNGDYNGSNLPAGTYSINADPFSQNSLGGTEGFSLLINFTLTNPSVGLHANNNAATVNGSKSSNSSSNQLLDKSIETNDRNSPKEIKVWPNPFQDNITLQLEHGRIYKRVFVQDLRGTLITNVDLQGTIGGEEVRLQIDGAAGIYLMYVETSDGMEVKKIVKF